MKDKILEILLKKWKSSPTAASEIAGMVKEFTEWLAFKSHGNFNPKFELHKYWDGTVNEWRTIFRKFDGLRWIDITIDELFDYWYDNIYKSTDK